MTDTEKQARAENWLNTRIEPAFFADISHELPDDLRVYRRSIVLKLLAAYGSSEYERGRIETIKLQTEVRRLRDSLYDLVTDVRTFVNSSSVLDHLQASIDESDDALKESTVETETKFR